MKDRIVFFILGAVLATLAYFAGDMNTADSQVVNGVHKGDLTIDGELNISGTVTVGGGRLTVMYLDDDYIDSLIRNQKPVIINGIHLNVSEKNAAITAAYGLKTDKSVVSEVFLVAGEDETGGVSGIALTGKVGKDTWKRNSRD